MARYIDADALIEAMTKFSNATGEDMTHGIFYAHIAPTIEAEPHWIPCSERLPDDDATVLITHKGGVSFGWYNGRYWERGASTKHRLLQTVTAWMPLPKPYKGDKE